MAFRINSTLKNSIAQALVDVFNGTGGTVGATINLYTGTQPGTGGASTSGCLSLATISNVLWNNATGGTAILSALAYGTTGTSGTITWLRCESDKGDVIDAECGTAGTEAFALTKTIFDADEVVTIISAHFIQT